MAAKLLLAEDSLTIQKVFELSLKQTGISLTVVDNGNDAIRLAKEISPDLVVADVSLPGKDAFDVAAVITSYSIHYTKLYDSPRPRGSSRRLQATSSLPPP